MKERDIEQLSALVSAAEATLYKQDFNSLMRTLEAALFQYPRWGTARQPQDDPLRIGQTPSLAFASASVPSITLDDATAKIVIEQAFLGLLGANGPMPNHISEYVNERSRHHQDHTLSAFFNLFHHRILTLFYRIWAESEPVTYLDRPEQDRFGGYLSALMGHREEVPESLHSMPRALAGHYTQMAPTAEGVAAIVTHCLGLPVAVEEFQGAWLPLERENQCGLDGVTQLGGAFFLGERHYSSAASFKVVVGPIEQRDDFFALKPKGELRALLNQQIQEYVGFEFTWCFEVRVDKSLLEGEALGADQDNVQLGWNTLLSSNVTDVAQAGTQPYQVICC